MLTRLVTAEYREAAPRIFCLGTGADIGPGTVLIGGIEGGPVSKRLGNIL